jgi:hypothetical protein
LRRNAHSVRESGFPWRSFGDDRVRIGTFGDQPRLGFGAFALWAITSSATATATATTFCRLARLNRFL